MNLMNHYEFAEKLETHKNTVYRLSFSYLKNIHDAEDITQEAFLKFYSCGINFPASVNEKAWLIRVTANMCKNQLRRNKFKKLLPFDTVSENALINEIPNFMESDLEALDLLNSLKPKYRIVLYLFYYERHTTREIAQMLGKNENTVRCQMARGREQLREILTEDFKAEKKGGVVYGQQI